MKRTLILASAAFLLVSLFASSAFALDGYRDRKGLYGGAMLMGSSSQADYANATGNLGLGISLRVGGGINSQLTLDLSVASRSGTATEGGADVTTTSSSMFLGANYFVNDGFYVRGMGGLAQLTSEVGPFEDSETGLGAGVGLGYEFFGSADLAIGVGGDFQIHSFDDVSVQLMNIGVTATWY